MENISIAGSGKISCGEYAAVTISGSGRVTGNLRCTEMRCAGSAHTEGDVACAGVVKCAGSFRCGGNMQAGELHASGSCSLGGDVRADVLKTAGSVSVAGRVQAGQLSGAGSFAVDGDVEGDDVSLAGSIRIGGLLNAERLCIRLGGNSRVGSIGGGEIRVERGREGGGFLGLFRKNGSGMLSVSTIEGDTVALENTEAETVRGREVVISSGCKIGCVEYTVSLRVEGDGQVAERRQV